MGDHKYLDPRASCAEAMNNRGDRFLLVKHYNVGGVRGCVKYFAKRPIFETHADDLERRIFFEDGG